ncbi:MAG TPA: protein kinase, partial [Anaerolineae bacterium]
MSSFQLFLFGAPRLERDGELVFINRRRAMALLAYLAVTGQSHSRDVVATLFWPQRDQSNARANLRRDLSRLKQALDDEVLLIDRLHAGVNPEAELWLDVAAFQGNVVKAQQHGHPPQALCTDCYTALIEAVVLYSDDFMAGFSLPDSPEFDDWQFFQAESLRRSLAGALEQLIHWCIKQGEYEQGIEHGRRWLALDSLHEPAHRQLMQLYAWSGQQAAAIRQYQECVRLLDEELGVEPEEETLLLYETIKARQLAPPELSAVPPSPLLGATPAPPPHERYVQQELLMASGQGEVYLGLDRVANQPVVIKRLRSDLVARRPELVTRLVREGEALSQLNHPNIVRMLAVLERDEDYAIVMEYVVGGSLRQLLDEVSQLPLERALDIALELADALGRAHHLNIIHRDLKPDNVLLAADGTPRLTDFGMARLGGDEARLTQTGSFIGSPAYMSPEALHGEELDARSDVWSFGVLLYEMLAGRRPFAGTHITSVLVSILNDPVPELQHFRPDVPPPLANLLQRMLVKERQERIASMRQVAAELEAIRAGKGDIKPGEPERRISKIVSSPRIRSFTPVHRRTPTSTPLPATPFVGREQELADITNALANADTRLLTIVGPGGIGKTRLALAAVERVISPFADGVYFVPLAPLESAEHIASALANSLDYHFRGSGEPKQQLLDYLHHRRLLLVLDNFEHLLEGAGLVAEILAHAPGVKVLATARERLNLSGEMVYTLGGMSYPDWQRATETDVTAYSAVQLLLQRARLVRPDFKAERHDLVHATRICQLVEGMPLALVLAAGWLELLSLEEIAAEIAQSLDFLETEMRDVPERQRSMRAVFASSWARLTEEEQQVFRKLTVFRGGFTRQAAHAVAGATLHSLRALLNKSFITVDQDGRYGMHELLRQFGTEKLLASAEAETTVDAHCAFYLSSLRQREADLKGGRQLPALREITLDIDNVRMAWWHAIERQDVRALEQSAACLWLYSDMRGALHEGEAAFRQATAAFSDVVDVDSEVTVPDERVSLLGFLIAGQGMMRAQRGELEAGRTMMEKGIALLRRFVADDRHKYRVAFSLVWLGWVVFLQAKNDEAERLIQESLALFTDIGDRWGIAKSLFALGNNYTAIGQLKASEKPLRECLTICKEIDDRRGLLLANRNLSILTYWFGDYAQTKQLLDEADALSREF